MSDFDILSTLAPDECYLITSRSGRVLQTSPAFDNLIGSNATGRNLNDFLDDNIVSELILKVRPDDVFLIDCRIGGCICSCGARLSGPGRMVLVFKLLEDRVDPAEDRELVRYLSRQINRNLDDLGLALRALGQANEEGHARAAGLLSKSLLNLNRISRNAALKADHAEGDLFLLPKPGDLMELISSVCERTAALAEPYFDIYFEREEGTAEGIYDATIVQRSILNLIHHALTKSPLPRPRIRIRLTIEEGQVIFHLQSAGSAATIYEPVLGPGGHPLYGEDMELDVASILVRALQGSLISSRGNDGRWICRAAYPIVPLTDDTKISNTVIDWYGGKDMIAVELSGILPAEAYAESAKN